METRGKTFIFVLVQSILLIISFIYLRDYLTFHDICLYGTVTSIIIFIILMVVSHSVFSNIIFIYLSFVLFQFGIPILYAIDKGYNNFYITLFSSGTLNQGTIFTIICIQVFALGISLYYLFDKSYHRMVFSKCKWANNDSMVVKAAFCLFVFCSVIYIPYTLYGAFVLHSRFSMPAIGNIAKQFYFPSALLILCYSKNKKLRRFIYFMYLLECLGSMLTGGRTEGLVPVMVLVVYYFQYSEHSKSVNGGIIRNMLYVVFLFFIIMLLVVIAQVRVGNTISTSQFNLKNIFEMFVGELGFNFTTILFVISGIQLYGYQKGLSYISDLITLIPQSLDPTGTINKLQGLSGANWLQMNYGQKFDFGLGFSIIGEAYFNFGNYGAFVIFIFGILIAALQCKPADKCTNWEKYIQLALLIGLLTVTRRDFYQFLKQIEYGIFMMSLYLFICYRIRISNKF